MRYSSRKWKTSLAALAALSALAATALAQPFALHDGDRVVFYGDSITDQRLYTTFAETYVVTRFPKLDVAFVHSGWGGDRVTGGGGGPIDVRLWRDVLAYNPTVMTIMLGMNDGGYKAFDQQLFDNYAAGYKHIVETVKKQLPGIRITAIQPSPYDDVTREPMFEGGYNKVLLRFSDFVKQLSVDEKLGVADLNGPVAAMLAKAKDLDAAGAAKILPDRVHPGPGGHLIMAEALLKSWNAPATNVSSPSRRAGPNAYLPPSLIANSVDRLAMYNVSLATTSDVRTALPTLTSDRTFLVLPAWKTVISPSASPI